MLYLVMLNDAMHKVSYSVMLDDVILSGLCYAHVIHVGAWIIVFESF